MILDRWIRGRDPKIITRERIEYENRKNNSSNNNDTTDKELEKKIAIADKFMQDNPQLLEEIDSISIERAKKLAR